MRNKDSRHIEARLKKAVEQSVPDVLDNILSACDCQERKVVEMTMPKKSKSWIAAVSAAAAVFLIGAFGFYGYQVYKAAHRVDTIIGLDVNPSLTLQISSKEKVLDVTPLNEDAVKILDDMELKGTALDVALNALVGSMVKNGYINELANSVLVSVENDNPEKGTALQQKITEELQTLLSSDGVQGAVLSQTLTEDNQTRQLADKYDISIGKASLIQTILAQNPALLFEDLATLSINELNLLAASNEGNQSLITSTGTASDKAYIGYEKAKTIALEHAGVSAGDAVSLEAELDWENGRMVYEVEFYAGTKEYDYDIDASTGVIQKFKVNDHQQASNNGEVPTAFITAAQAKEAALKHAGFSDSQISKLEIDFDQDNGIAIYEIEFYCGNTKYEYEIDASNSSIRKHDSETKKEPSHTSIPDTPSDKDYISLDQAKEIAFTQAGVTAADIRELKAKFDWEDGYAVYEIEFYKGQIKYEYDIDAQNGTVRKTDIETEDDAELPDAPDASYITSQKAKEIALSDAGLSAGAANKLEVEFEQDDDKAIYKVEFEQGNVEYEYEIDALTGNILSSEKDIDDD